MTKKLAATLQYVGDAYAKVDKQGDINGRRLAGGSFIRGFLKHTSSENVQMLMYKNSAHQPVAEMVKGLATGRRATYLKSYQLDKLGDHPVIYRPDPELSSLAYQRMHFGQAAFSICGVTHTTSGYHLPDPFINLRGTPVEPWDGLICTADTVLTSLTYRLDAIDEFNARRFGGKAPPRPQMPVIPLGLHVDEFDCTAADRAKLRAEINAGDDDIVVGSLSRLSPQFKFDPFPVYLAMERAHQATGKTFHILFSGFFLGAYARSVFLKGAAALAPNVKIHVRPADNEDQRREAMAGSDIFIFPIDNVQETFGLAPIEAMAAGLPVIGTDWNGLKDTITPDVGFRIPTRTVRGEFSRFETFLNETGFDPNPAHSTVMSAMAELNVPAFAEKLALLATNVDLRRKMGAAGRARAETIYDWKNIIPQYEAFWAELDAIRRAATKKENDRYKGVPSPAAPPVYDFFACYPTVQGFAPEVTFVAGEGADADRLDAIYKVRNYGKVKRSPVNKDSATELLRLIASAATPPDFAKLLQGSGLPEATLEQTLVWLLKYDLIATQGG